MAITNLFVLFVYFSLVLSAPVSEDIKSVPSKYNMAVELTERTVVFNLNSILNRAKDNKHVESLGSVTDDRNKRETIKGNQRCPHGMKWILKKCVTIKKFNASKNDDEYEISLLPEDSGTKLRSQMTTRTTPTSHLTQTLYSVTTSSPEQTSHSITTIPELITETSTTPHPELNPAPNPTPHSLKNKSSKQDHISSSLLYFLAVILVPYQIWCHHQTIF